MAGGLLWKLLETLGMVVDMTVDLEVVQEVDADLEAGLIHQEEDFRESLHLEMISATTVDSTATGQVPVLMEIGVTDVTGVVGTGICGENVQACCLVVTQNRVGQGVAIVTLPIFLGVLGPDRDLQNKHAPEVIADPGMTASDLEPEADMEICPLIEMAQSNREIWFSLVQRRLKIGGAQIIIAIDQDHEHNDQ